MNDRTALNFLIAIGLFSLADLIGTVVYRKLQSQMPTAPDWTPESALRNATSYFDQAQMGLKELSNV